MLFKEVNLAIQASRLLAEIIATQDLDMDALGESMDLTTDEVDELLSHAQSYWDHRIKDGGVPTYDIVSPNEVCATRPDDRVWVRTPRADIGIVYNKDGIDVSVYSAGAGGFYEDTPEHTYWIPGDTLVPPDLVMVKFDNTRLRLTGYGYQVVGLPDDVWFGSHGAAVAASLLLQELGGQHSFSSNKDALKAYVLRAEPKELGRGLYILDKGNDQPPTYLVHASTGARHSYTQDEWDTAVAEAWAAGLLSGERVVSFEIKFTPQAPTSGNYLAEVHPDWETELHVAKKATPKQAASWLQVALKEYPTVQEVMAELDEPLRGYEALLMKWESHADIYPYELTVEASIKKEE